MKVFSYYYKDKFLWFRLFGYGLLIKNIENHPLLFSQRRGYNKSIVLRGYYLQLLFK